jgi:peptidyl-prolyl cis-trans isomerase D
MRENTKWIMLVTALAFVALMVFEWGMDITGRSSGGLGEIGRVNGEAVMYDDYIATYRNLYDQVQRSQGQPITSQQTRQLEDQAWEQMVTSILIQQELDRRGIQVTDEEIREAALYAPPPALQNDPTFRTDGQFDLQKYQTFLRNSQDEQLLLYLESYYRDVLPRGKLLRQLTAGVYPTDAELWQSWRDQYERVEVNYVGLPPAQRVSDAEVEVTDREIRDYYDDNREDFQRPAQALVRAVVLGKAPLASDTAAALERAREVREEILGGADFAEVAARESADEGSAAAGGSLGTFGRDYMDPIFEEAAFSASVGQVTEPVRTPFGYHLIEVESRTADSVTARHVLVPIERTEESELTLLSHADSLELMSEQQGLDAASSAFDLPIQTVTVQALIPFISGAGQVGEGVDWAMEEAAPGEVSPLFETPEAFYVLELVTATPAGELSLEDATPTIQSALMIEKKAERTVEEARALVQRVRGGQSLQEVAAAEGLDVVAAGPFSRYDFVPTLGSQNAAIGAAFGLRPGQVSDPIRANSNVFVLEQVNLVPADSTEWLDQKELQRQQLTSMLQNRRMDEWLQEIRSDARVVDRRLQVLQPVTDEEPARGIPNPFGG